MEYICYANQEYPKEQFKKFFKSKQTKNTIYSYLEVLQNNGINNLDILYDLEKKGCTYAYAANALVTKLITDSDKNLNSSTIKEVFGFPLSTDDNTLDCNILMLDMFAFLYDKVKLTVHKYENYHYKNAIEAVKDLFGKEPASEEEAILELLNNNIRPDGIDSETKENKYKKMIPDNQVIYGSYPEIAKSLLNIEDNDMNKEKLTKLLSEKGIIFEEHDKSPESKLSGLTEANINTWINYYLLRKNISLEFKSELLPKDNNNYDEFQNNLKTLLSEGYILGIASSPNSDAFIISNKEKERVSSKEAGHKMLITGFDENNNLLVSSWGKDFTIAKEHYKDFTYTKVKIKTPEIIKSNDKENNFKY